ncbi:transcription factor bHLH150-like [Oryza brachyantha]|uniref:transcription factor bHLH150-like n=1 Tax=Oryza brachyantha TaxID=4533 RepID=UPI001ADCB401|nr:transcription factor bHLH150-like [Oryza brachyantha]
MISIGGSSSSSSSSGVRVAGGGAKVRGKAGTGAAVGTGVRTRWRSGTQERIYGRRLLDALRATRDGGAPAQPRAVKAAADSALALTARGQSRWSRAILLAGAASSRRRVLVKAGGKIRRHHRRPQARAAAAAAAKAAAASSAGEPPMLKERKVKERLRVLGRLVPGCRKLPAPALLEETADYVAALEMQVKAMRALADALAAAQLSSSPPQQAEATSDEPEMER